MQCNAYDIHEVYNAYEVNNIYLVYIYMYITIPDSTIEALIFILVIISITVISILC